LHVQRAMLGHLMTGRCVLDLQEDDVYWCTADPGAGSPGRPMGFSLPG